MPSSVCVFTGYIVCLLAVQKDTEHLLVSFDLWFPPDAFCEAPSAPLSDFCLCHAAPPAPPSSYV